MSFDQNPRGTDLNGVPRSSRSPSSWLIMAAVAVVVLFGIGYMYQGRWMGTTDVHGASDAPAPGAAPATPLPSVSPAATPKP